jgi:hypothetical protein
MGQALRRPVPGYPRHLSCRSKVALLQCFLLFGQARRLVIDEIHETIQKMIVRRDIPDVAVVV